MLAGRGLSSEDRLATSAQAGGKRSISSTAPNWINTAELNVTRDGAGLMSGSDEWLGIVLTQQAFPLAQLLNSVHFILARET